MSEVQEPGTPPRSWIERQTVSHSVKYAKWLKRSAIAGISAPMIMWGYQTFYTKEQGKRVENRVDALEKTYLSRSEKNTNRLVAHIDKVGDKITSDFRRELKALEERTLRAETIRDQRIDQNRNAVEELKLLIGLKGSPDKTKGSM